MQYLTGIIIAIVIVIFVIIFKLSKKKVLIHEKPKTKETQPTKEIKTSEIKQPEKKIEIKLPEAIKKLDKDIAYIKKEISEGIQKAANEYGMNYSDVEEMVKSELYSQIENAKNKIYKAIEEKNYEVIDKETHSLKGASLNLKIDVLGLAFKEIDDAARRKEDMNKIKLYIDKLYNVYEKLK